MTGRTSISSTPLTPLSSSTKQRVSDRQNRKLEAAEEGARLEAEAAYEQSLKATARANTLREVQEQRACLEQLVRFHSVDSVDVHSHVDSRSGLSGATGAFALG